MNDTDEGILENNSVTARRRLNSIGAGGKTRPIISAKIQLPTKERKTNDQQRNG